MAITVHCDIVSADESLFSGLVEMVVATGSMGELGVTAGHAPLLSDLRPGPVRWSNRMVKKKFTICLAAIWKCNPIISHTG